MQIKVDKNEKMRSKIVDREEALSMLSIWHYMGLKVVFTNGCFDVIHKGHVDYLSRASSLGDRMIVGLNTDKSVSNLKGPSRPIQDERSRAEIVASMFFVDAVVMFDEETPYELINFLKPDILVKGSDYSIDNIIGADVVMANGGRVETMDFVDGYSTTNIINKIKNTK
jgi:rfaE bifunctional protein nucleotidyltransferase chain/domain